MPSFSGNSPSILGQGVVRNPSRLREVLNVEPDSMTDSMGGSKHTSPLPVQNEVIAYTEALLNSATDEVFGDDGLLSRFYLICLTNLDRLSSSGLQDESTEVQNAQLECKTWDLLQRLYLERTKVVEAAPEVNADMSNAALVQNLYDSSNEAAEIKIILDWLHDGCGQEVVLDIRSNRWFYTKENIKSKRRTNLGAQTQKMIDSLDPDAPVREGKRLAEEDSEYERNLIKAMFHCIRAGDHMQAAELARRSGEHWRAASLQGCVEQSDAQRDQATDEVRPPEGTYQKPLWRRMCFALSQQTTFDSYERALYGALCGDIGSVTPVLQTWDDRLWVHMNAINQAKVENHLRQLGRVKSTQNLPISDYSHLTPHTVLESLLHSDQEAVRQESRIPLRVVQARLMTNQLDVLLHDIHQQLQSVQRGGSASGGVGPNFIRFVVHLILILRKLRITIPEEPSNAVIQAYVEILIMTNEATAIALYASQLPPSDTVEALARYFMLVEDEEERARQLRIARQFGIDTSITILRAIELTFENILSDFVLGEAIRNINCDVDAGEASCIRALEWLNLDDTLQQEAILLGNNLFRKFLLSGRTSAAKTLAIKMPDTKLVSIDMTLEDDSDQRTNADESQMRNAIEYVGYCTLVKALARYEDWKALIRAKPQEVNGRRDPVGLRQWKTDLNRLRMESIVVMKEILSGSWCDPIELGITDQVIIDEMLNLRTMYIPDVVLKLHGVYAAHEGREVSSAMELAVLVAENLTVPMKQSGMLSTYISEVALLGAYLV